MFVRAHSLAGTGAYVCTDDQPWHAYQICLALVLFLGQIIIEDYHYVTYGPPSSLNSKSQNVYEPVTEIFDLV